MATPEPIKPVSATRARFETQIKEVSEQIQKQEEIKLKRKSFYGGTRQWGVSGSGWAPAALGGSPTARDAESIPPSTPTASEVPAKDRRPRHHTAQGTRNSGIRHPITQSLYDSPALNGSAPSSPTIAPPKADKALEDFLESCGLFPYASVFAASNITLAKLLSFSDEQIAALTEVPEYVKPLLLERVDRARHPEKASAGAGASAAGAGAVTAAKDDESSSNRSSSSSSSVPVSTAATTSTTTTSATTTAATTTAAAAAAALSSSSSSVTSSTATSAAESKERQQSAAAAAASTLQPSSSEHTQTSKVEPQSLQLPSSANSATTTTISASASASAALNAVSDSSVVAASDAAAAMNGADGKSHTAAAAAAPSSGVKKAERKRHSSKRHAASTKLSSQKTPSSSSSSSAPPPPSSSKDTSHKKHRRKEEDAARAGEAGTVFGQAKSKTHKTLKTADDATGGSSSRHRSSSSKHNTTITAAVTTTAKRSSRKHANKVSRDAAGGDVAAGGSTSSSATAGGTAGAAALPVLTSDAEILALLKKCVDLVAESELEEVPTLLKSIQIDDVNKFPVREKGLGYLNRLLCVTRATDIQERAVAILSQLSLSDSPQLQESMHGSILFLTELISSPYAYTQQHAMITLATVVYKNPDNLAVCLKTKAVNHLLAIISRAEEVDAFVLIDAIICLRALAEFNPAGQDAVYQAQGVHPVLRLLNHPNAEVQMSAIDAVLSLVRSNAQIKELVQGSIVTIVNLLGVELESIRAVACGVLMELARENEACQQIIFQCRAVQPLINCISSQNEYMQFHALGIITFLILKNDERRRAFIDAGLEAPVTQLLHSKNENIRTGASVITKILAAKKKKDEKDREKQRKEQERQAKKERHRSTKGGVN